jgi:hypothetical protein
MLDSHTMHTALHCTALHCTALHCTALHQQEYILFCPDIHKILVYPTIQRGEK